MTIDFYDGTKKIGTIIDSPTGLRATGQAVTVLDAARGALLSDPEIVAKYQDWSNGYQHSRERRERIDD